MSTVDEESEESLMAAYAAGDKRAFDRLFTLVAPRIHAFFMRSFRDQSAADELMQITFLRLHKSRAGYRTGARLRPWLFAIAANVRRDEWRKRYRLAEDVGEEALIAAEQAQLAGSVAEPGPAEDPLSEVRSALDALPEVQRTILQLHRYEGMTYVEIAEALGTTPGAARQHAFRAYESVRARVAQRLGREAALEKVDA